MTTRATAGLVGVLLAFCTIDLSAARTTIEVIRESNAQMASILRPGRTPTKDEEARALALIREVTNFDALAGTAIGAAWPAIPLEKRSRFTAAFGELVARSAIAKLGQYRADRVDVLDEQIDGSRAVVRTVATFKNKKTPLDYILLEQGGTWQVVDYRLAGVLTSANYRKQFDQILAKEPFDALLARIEKRLPKS